MKIDLKLNLELLQEEVDSTLESIDRLKKLSKLDIKVGGIFKSEITGDKGNFYYYKVLKIKADKVLLSIGYTTLKQTRKAKTPSLDDFIEPWISDVKEYIRPLIKKKKKEK